MIYLLLNILFSSVFMLVVRWRQKQGEDLITLGAINYIAGAGLALLTIQETGLTTSSDTAYLLGGINGAFYFIAFIFLIPLLAHREAALSAAVSRMSILLPIFGGIIFWSERPSSLQYVGIASACFSLFLIGNKGIRSRVTEGQPHRLLLMLLFFVTAGLARLTQEAFRHYGPPEDVLHYVLSTFVVAGAISIPVLIIRRRRPTVSEVLFGSVVGISNNLQVYFILRALGEIRGFVVFPVASVGGLLLTVFFAIALLKERLTRFGFIGIGMAIFALGLLNYPS